MAIPSGHGAWVGTVPDLESILAGPNDAQRVAALALRVQVRSGAFEPSQIFAVTFTDRTADELERRLQALGVDGVASPNGVLAALVRPAGRLLHAGGSDRVRGR